MIDFSKAYCNLHPHQLITNFCTKPQCLTGLCANCICTHTQYHVQNGTSPQYQNIRTTYKKIQENIREQVEAFESDKKRIEKIHSKMQQKRDKVKQVIQVAQDDAMKLLQVYFQDKQNRMLRQIEAQEKKYGLHCEGRLESLNNSVSREVSSLLSATQQINSQNFLQSLPRMRTHILVNAESLHKDVNDQLTHNENFNTTITYERSRINELKNVLQRTVLMSISKQGGPVKPINSRVRPGSEDKAYNRHNSELINCRPQSPGRVPPRNQSQINMFSPQAKLGNLYSAPRPMSNQTDSVQESSRQFRPSYLNQVQNTAPPVQYLRPQGLDQINPVQNPLQPQNQSYNQNSKISMTKTDFSKNLQSFPLMEYPTFQKQDTQPKTMLGKKSRKSGLRVINQLDSQSEISKQNLSQSRANSYQTGFV